MLNYITIIYNYIILNHIKITLFFKKEKAVFNMNLETSLQMTVLLWRFFSWIQIQTTLSECHSGDINVFLHTCEFLPKVFSGGQEQIVRKDNE